MAKAKFERNKPHLNVGTIGHVDVPRLREGRFVLQVFSAVTKSPEGQNYNKTKGDSDQIGVADQLMAGKLAEDDPDDVGPAGRARRGGVRRRWCAGAAFRHGVRARAR